jgi:sugar O-acyltransferase (sialic acid O-acetyltransferase NeuD family)
MKKVVIYGLGETAILAYEYFTHDSDYEVVAFAVDREFKETDTFNGLPVVDFEDISNLYPPKKVDIFVASASGKLNRVRTSMYLKAKEKGYTCASYVSSKAFVWHNAEIGENCFIMEDNTIQPFTKVGNNVVMWSGNHLGHRSVIRDNCFITSHVVISGYCEIGENTFIGVNAAIANNIKIGKDNFIAMGCIINRNTEEDGFYEGNPSRKRDVFARKFCKVEN